MTKKTDHIDHIGNIIWNAPDNIPATVGKIQVEVRQGKIILKVFNRGGEKMVEAVTWLFPNLHQSERYHDW